MDERIAADPVGHLDVGVLRLGSVEVEVLAGVEQHFDDARDGDRRRAVFRHPGRAGLRLAAVGDAGQHGRVGRRRAAAGVVVGEAEPAARQADLAEHRGERHQHPVALFAVLLALQRPAGGEHRPVLGEAVCEVLDRVSRNVADRGRPFGALRRLVVVAHQIRQELVEAVGVGLEELLVMEFLDDQRMGDAQHQRDVGLRPRGDPLGAEELGGVGLDRIDANDLGALGLERLQALVAAVVGDRPADLVGDHRIAAPEHHQLGLVDHHRPHRLLLVHFERADHVRHDDLRRSGRVVARRVHEIALQVHHPAQQALAIVQAARALPAVRTGEGRRGAVGLLDPLQFLDDQVERLIPGDAHEVAAAAAVDVGAGPFLEEGAADHRVFDAGRRIDRIEHAGELMARRGIFLPRLHRDDASALNLGAEGAPVRARQHFAVGRRRASACRQQRRSGDAHGAERHAVTQECAPRHLGA